MTTTPTLTSSAAELAEARDASLLGIIAATGEAVAQDATRAQVRFAATGRSTGAVATDVRSRQHTFVVDEPASLGGDDSSTNPVEYALGAFIGCQVVTYRFWAAHLGIRLDDVRVEAVGDLDVRGFFGLDDAVRAGFTEVRLDVRLSGPESGERYAELQRAVDAHCPVLDLFANATPVRTSVTVDAV
ncbi:MAG TPA: OsmC family protein [Actinotalea sp.]|nr:OsmC family protein [Actinotalea sp.]